MDNRITCKDLHLWIVEERDFVIIDVLPPECYGSRHIPLGDEEVSLAEYGIPGRIIPTPGHSIGSVSVLLETGDAFVGYLAMNAFPLRLSPGLPIFAEDLQEVKKSWHLLLAKGAKTVYPAHGKPFPADAIRRALS